MTATREVNGFLSRYVKRYHAGGFATPMSDELARGLASGAVEVHRDADGAITTVTVAERVERPGTRRDFAGNPYILPAGSTVITHLARVEGAPVPDLDWADFVYAYTEDHELAAALSAQRRAVRAVRISAAGEIVACWGRDGDGRRYPPWDVASLVRLTLGTDPERAAAAVAEVEALDGWHDDYPFYNLDGSWAALSLRGFKHDDPTYGLKPAEMSKKWLSEHPDDRHLTECGWTVLADRCPSLVLVVESIPWWRRFERIRLLRLAGTGSARLLRHTDITDKAAGTRDGQICRFHIPIVTHPACSSTVWGLDGRPITRHLAAWDLWYLDQRKPHLVENPTDVNRVHLVVDVLADDEVRQQIGHAYLRETP